MSDSVSYRKPAEVHFRDDAETVVTYDHVDRDGGWLLTFDDGENGGMPTWWPLSAVKKVDRLPHVGADHGGSQNVSDMPGDTDADVAEAVAGPDSDGVTEVSDPDSTQEAYVDAMKTWFAQAAGVNGFDPSIVDLSWGEAGGTGGVIVELSPFEAGYWSDGDWTDKEGFETGKERAKDTLLKPRDEFEWFGEPDYLNFIAEADIDEVVG